MPVTNNYNTASKSRLEHRTLPAGVNSWALGASCTVLRHASKVKDRVSRHPMTAYFEPNARQLCDRLVYWMVIQQMKPLSPSWTPRMLIVLMMQMILIMSH